MFKMIWGYLVVVAASSLVSLEFCSRWSFQFPFRYKLLI